MISNSTKKVFRFSDFQDDLLDCDYGNDYFLELVQHEGDRINKTDSNNETNDFLESSLLKKKVKIAYNTDRIISTSKRNCLKE